MSNKMSVKRVSMTLIHDWGFMGFKIRFC